MRYFLEQMQGEDCSFFVNYKGYVTVSQTLSNYRPFHLAQRISSDHYIFQWL